MKAMLIESYDEGLEPSYFEHWGVSLDGSPNPEAED
jgi:hypothetical protein